MPDENKYNIVNGTAYSKDTDPKVIKVLEDARQNHWRIKIAYGEVQTGKDWNEQHDTTGYVGRSSGIYKIPILLFNSKSNGGGSILDNCIVKIQFANKKNGEFDLYKHPNYNK